ncbi:MAG: NADH-quinone oxidoreductase subunit NuoN [Armatimonadetes bacterium]|nr:NADH-quinone oxidoreductase subunit NuoN [Armatimonadota bacterium]
MKPPFNLPAFEFAPMFPYIALAVTGMLGLVLHMVKPKGTSNSLFGWTLACVFVALLSQLGLIGNEYMELEMVFKDKSGILAETLILLSTFVVVLISNPYFKRTRIHCPEFYPLICWASLGGMIMCTSSNLLAIFVGLELLSISLYVLAGMNKRSKFSQEAALKYFLLGAFATGFFLYGIAFHYGASGTLNLDGFSFFKSQANAPYQSLDVFGFVLILVGFSFKCGVAPFHQWIPDVYSGAPTNIVAFMATGAKVGPFIALYHLIAQSAPLQHVAFPACVALSVLSMVVGNAMAFTQSETKKLLAYSSVANAGYIMAFLAALSAARSAANWTLLYFLIGYVFATLGVFIILALAEGDQEGPQTIDSLRGLSKRHPMLAALLVVFVLSQIGIGPVAGFVGKVLIVSDLVRLDQAWLAIVLVANSAFGAFYYFKLVRSAYSEEGETTTGYELSSGAISALAICALVVVGSVIFYAPLVSQLGQR